MIRLRQIKKSFQDKSGINEVLRGIDLEVSEGEFVSITWDLPGQGNRFYSASSGCMTAPGKGSIIFSTKPSTR